MYIRCLGSSWVLSDSLRNPIGSKDVLVKYYYVLFLEHACISLYSKFLSSTCANPVGTVIYKAFARCMVLILVRS